MRVTTARGVAAAFAEMQPFAPAFFRFEPASRKYVTAVHPDGALVGPLDLAPGWNTRPAAPGDVIILFGTGFGPSSPATPAGEIATLPAVLASPVFIRIGGVTASVTYAGLTGPGLYQFNVIVPRLPDGDFPVAAEVGGIVSTTGGMLSIHQR